MAVLEEKFKNLVTRVIGVEVRRMLESDWRRIREKIVSKTCLSSFTIIIIDYFLYL